MNNFSVSEVKLFSESKGVVTYGFHIEKPEEGALISSDQFVVAGWIVGRISRAVEVNILLSGEVIAVALVNVDRPDIARAIPAAEEARSSGFRVDIPVVSLQGASEINLIAKLADGTQVPLANICFEKQVETGITTKERSKVVGSISEQGGKPDGRTRILGHGGKEADSISEQGGVYTRFINRFKAKFRR